MKKILKKFLNKLEIYLLVGVVLLFVATTFIGIVYVVGKTLQLLSFNL